MNRLFYGNKYLYIYESENKITKDEEIIKLGAYM